jgi:thioredoxin reductase
VWPAGVTPADGPVVVVGGGPAGLACAIELRRLGIVDVVVLEREAHAGGIPRHCGHQGFGARDLHRLMAGPRYARRYVEHARSAGVSVEQETMVTGWSAAGELELTSPSGRTRVAPAAVVLTTGCRERPRAARLVAGSRPAGVMTTGTLQQLVYLGGERIGGRALIVGAEHVSFSALLTLSHAGAKVIGMVTELPRHQSLAAVRAAAAVRFRVPLWTRTAVTAIRGHPRVEAVELEHLDSGARRAVSCASVVFTADWIPDLELAATGGVELDPGTRGPRTDTALRTARAGVFAAGNVLHGAEPADVAALSGRHAAGSVARWLADRGDWPAAAVPITCRAPLQWISPNAIAPAREAPPRGRFLLRCATFLRRPELEIRQDARVLWRKTIARVGPGRSVGLPADWRARIDPGGGPIELAVVQSRAHA